MVRAAATRPESAIWKLPRASGAMCVLGPEIVEVEAWFALVTVVRREAAFSSVPTPVSRSASSRSSEGRDLNIRRTPPHNVEELLVSEGITANGRGERDGKACRVGRRENGPCCVRVSTVSYFRQF